MPCRYRCGQYRHRGASDMMEFSMGQLRTANKRRNRALAAKIAATSATGATAAKPAAARKTKRATA